MYFIDSKALKKIEVVEQTNTILKYQFSGEFLIDAIEITLRYILTVINQHSLKLTRDLENSQQTIQ